MFAIGFSVRNSKKLFFIALAVITALAVACVAATVFMLENPSYTAHSNSAGDYSLLIKNGDYEAFFSQLGLNADQEQKNEKSVIIPADFDEVYLEYNELQKAAGLDLSDYKGRKASCIKFPLKSGAANYAVILVCEERVIGGHLTDGEYGSKMLPLTQ